MLLMLPTKLSEVRASEWLGKSTGVTKLQLQRSAMIYRVAGDTGFVHKESGG